MNKIFVKTKKPGFSVALAAVFILALFILVCLLGVLPDTLGVIKGFILGLFGVAAYAYCLFAVMLSTTLLLGYKIVVKRTTLFKFGVFFFVFIMLLHTVSANYLVAGNDFSDFCEKTFSSVNTAGGLIFSVFTYHILSLLGLSSASALYAILLFGLILLIAVPYLRVRQIKMQQKDNPSLTQVKNGVLRQQPVVTNRKPYASPISQRPLPRTVAAGGFDPAYPNKSYEMTDKEKREAAIARLYENSDRKIVLENTEPYEPEVMTVQKKEEAPLIADDWSDYTNNGRIEILRKNMNKSVGEEEDYAAAAEQNADDDYDENKDAEAPYAWRDGENEESDIYGFNITRADEAHRRAEPSLLGNDLEEVRERYRREAEREKALRAESDRRRIAEEREKREQGYKASTKKFGFIDPDVEESVEFVNVDRPDKGDYDSAERFDGYKKADGLDAADAAELAELKRIKRERDYEKAKRLSIIESAEFAELKRKERESQYDNADGASGEVSPQAARLAELRRRKRERELGKPDVLADDVSTEAADIARFKRKMRELEDEKNGYVNDDSAEVAEIAEITEIKRRRRRAFGTPGRYNDTGEPSPFDYSPVEPPQPDVPYEAEERGYFEKEKDELNEIRRRVEKNGRNSRMSKRAGAERESYTAPDVLPNPFAEELPNPFAEEFPNPFADNAYETDNFATYAEPVKPEYVSKPVSKHEFTIRHDRRTPFKIPPQKTDEQITFERIEPISHAPYTRPPVELLLPYPYDNAEDSTEIAQNTRDLEDFFTEFKIGATSLGAIMGPTFTRYEMQMPRGIPVSRVKTLDNDISMRLKSHKKIRIEAPIPGKNAFGIEVPNKKRSIVGMRALLQDDRFYDESDKLTFTIGKDISGVNHFGDLADLPHLLVAGATGSGKSCCLNALIVSFLYKYGPEELRLVLIDPKRVELTMYEGLPHLLIPEIIIDDEKVINALDWTIKEMHRRYDLMHESYSNKIEDYNKKVPQDQRLYRIVVVIDEMAELIMGHRREIEPKIQSLLQLARAAGIHVVLATQRPSVNIITGVIKANMPARIAFGTVSNVDSRTILDRQGAEKLLGKGDMLYQSQASPEPVRLQGVFISNPEIIKVVDYVKQNNEAYYDSNIVTEINTLKAKAADNSSGDKNDESENKLDSYFLNAVKHVIDSKTASISMLQRKFSIGYARAARIIDNMEEKRIIGKGDGAKPRSVLITLEEFYELYGDLLDDSE
ncbi:MAG: DNA translocase FtsK [Clostridiales bacterium]|nr:DNA translocase FtsK [Clostridiales bacterium]